MDFHYHAPSAGVSGSRQDAFALATDGVVDHGDVSQVDGFDTFDNDDPQTDFGGLIYDQRIRIDRLVVDMGHQFANGGAWASEPRV